MTVYISSGAIDTIEHVIRMAVNHALDDTGGKAETKGVDPREAALDAMKLATGADEVVEGDPIVLAAEEQKAAEAAQAAQAAEAKDDQ